MSLVLLAAAASAGSWTPSATLAGPFAVSSPPEPPVIAVGSAGAALVAWDTQGFVGYAARPAGGRWSRALQVPRATGSGVAAAVGEDGTGALGWLVGATEFTPARIEVSVAPPGGRFPLAETVAEVPAASLHLAVAGDGTVALTWLESGGLHLATRGPGGWSAPLRVADAVVDHALSGTADGSLLLAWETDAAGLGEIRVAHVTGGVVPAPTPVSGGGDAWGVACALSPSGTGVVTFLEDGEVAAATGAGDAWTTGTVAAPADPVGWAPSVAVDDAGGAVVGWQTLGRSGGVAWWSRGVAGAWGPAERLSARAESATAPQVAVTGDGLVAGAAWVDDAGLGARARVEDLGSGAPVVSRRTLGVGTWGGLVPVGAGGGVFAAAFTGPVGGNPNAAQVVARAWE